MMNADRQLKVWLKKREWFYINLCFGSFIYGLSITVYYPTEYYYFKDYIKVKQPDMYYGLSWACLSGSGVVTSILASFYMDSTKNLRELCIFINLISVVGNLLYILYYSPFFILFGQILIGSGAARNVAGVGEIPRVYKTEQITRKMGIIGLYSTVGLITGPSFTFLFQKIDIRIASFRINIGNVIGVVMAIIYLLQLILNIATLENVSKMHNLKNMQEHSLNEKDKMALEKEDLKAKEKESKDINTDMLDELAFSDRYVKTFKSVLKSKHVVYLFFIGFFGTLSSSTITLLEPIKSFEYLQWNQPQLAKFIGVALLVGGLPSAVLLIVLSKYMKDYYLFTVTLIISFIPLILMGIFPILFNEMSTNTSSIYFYLIGISRLSFCVFFQSISKAILAKFVPENIQTLTEAIRNALFELSYMVAGLAVKFSATFVTPVTISMAAVIVVLLVWFIYESKVFKNIKIVQIS